METIYYELPEADRVCEFCVSVLTEMKKEIRRGLKIVPAKVSIVEHVTLPEPVQLDNQRCGVLKPLMLEMKKELLGNVTLCGCLVHAKRKFHEAWKVNPDNEDAKTGENYIQKLFATESKADKMGCSVEERLALRQKESKALLS